MVMTLTVNIIGKGMRKKEVVMENLSDRISSYMKEVLMKETYLLLR